MCCDPLSLATVECSNDVLLLLEIYLHVIDRLKNAVYHLG